MASLTSKARAQANDEISSQLEVINAAIESSKERAQRQKADYNRRGKNARNEVNKLYGDLIDQTKGLNTGINETYTGATSAAKAGGQSLIDAITNRGQEATSGVENTLAAAGIQGVGTEGLSDNLAVGEMIARNQANTINQNFGLMSSAAKAMGGWDVTGAKHDRSRSRTDVTSQVNDMISGVDETLRDYLDKQRLKKTEVKSQRDSLERQILAQLQAAAAAEAARNRSYYSGGGGGYYGGGRSYSSGGSSGGSSSNSKKLPKDAVPIDKYLGDQARKIGPAVLDRMTSFLFGDKYKKKPARHRNTPGANRVV